MEKKPNKKTSLKEAVDSSVEKSSSDKDEEKKKGHDHEHNTEKSNAKKPYTINLGGVELPIDLEPIEKMMEVSNI